MPRGLKFHQSEIGTTSERAAYNANPSNFDNDPANPASSSYDSTNAFYFSQWYVDAKGFVGSPRYMRASDYDAVDGWQRVEFVDEYSSTAAGYTTEMKLFFNTINEQSEDQQVIFDYDTTFGFSTSVGVLYTCAAPVQHSFHVS